VKKTFRNLALVAATLTMLTTATGAALASTNSVQAHAVTQAPQLLVDDSISPPVPIDAGGEPMTVVPGSANQCSRYSLCLWKNESLDGPFWSANYFNERHDEWLAVGSTLNNAATVVDNFRDIATAVAQFADGSGLVACIPPNTAYDLTHVRWPFSTTPMNDSITSYAFLTVTPTNCH
jgi:hypothetical protein